MNRENKNPELDNPCTNRHQNRVGRAGAAQPQPSAPPPNRPRLVPERGKLGAAQWRVRLRRIRQWRIARRARCVVSPSYYRANTRASRAGTLCSAGDGLRAENLKKPVNVL